MRDNTMMYRTQCEALRALPPEQFKAVVCALWDYEMDGKVPEDDPVVVAMFLMAKPLIDKRNQAYENGKKGGRPKTELKPDGNQTETECEPGENPMETEPNLKVKGKRIKVKESKDIYPYDEVIQYLNEKCGTKYRADSAATKRLINARFDEKYTLDDFKKVIDGRVAAWKGDAKMNEYLRPSTLFGTKFESYLNAKPGSRTGNKFVNFTGRTYNYEELEKKLTGVM